MAYGFASLKSVEVVFSRPRNWLRIFSFIYMLFTGRKFSHSSVRLLDPVSHTPLIIEISGTNSRFYYEKTFLDHHKVIERYRLNLTSAEYLQIWTLALSKLGSDHTTFEKAQNWIKTLFTWGWKSDKTTLLSEIAVKATVRSGMHNLRKPHSMSPKRLNKIMRGHHGMAS